MVQQRGRGVADHKERNRIAALLVETVNATAHIGSTFSSFETEEKLRAELELANKHIAALETNERDVWMKAAINRDIAQNACRELLAIVKRMQPATNHDPKQFTKDFAFVESLTKSLGNTDFLVEDASGREHCFRSFDAAVGFAAARAASNGSAVNVDICCYSLEDAKAFGCEESYKSDPDASATERIVIRAESIGSVP